ncbi:MAG: phage major tail tube protein [Faecousia sp.]
MSKLDQATIGLALYENGSEYFGIADVTLPDISYMTQVIQGAGIGGKIEAVMQGMTDTMSMTIKFRNASEHSIRLSEPRRHNIDLRIAQQYEDNVAGKTGARSLKHILVVIPKSDKGGNIAPASPSDGSGEYAVRYWATYIDGQLVREIDPFNYICNINGYDYLEDVRKALGK